MVDGYKNKGAETSFKIIDIVSYASNVSVNGVTVCVCSPFQVIRHS